MSIIRPCTSRLYAIVQGAVRFTGSWDEFATNEELIGSLL